MEKDLDFVRWGRLAVFNLLLVSSLGVILRYKIAFPLPFIHQKSLLHSHSHFAFSGWASFMIMILMIRLISIKKAISFFSTFRSILYLHVVCSYGMLVSFAIQGYGPVSIFFSTLSVLISIAFGWKFWKIMNDTNLNPVSFGYLKAAIVFNIISTIGTFWLVSLIITHHLEQNAYLSSIYFYLHFQYNGWFVFGCLGIFHGIMEILNISIPMERKIMLMLILTLAPCYLLSILWLNLPIVLYAFCVLSAFIQILAWTLLVSGSAKLWQQIHTHLNPVSKLMLITAAVAGSMKFLLQALSTIPALGHFAFGYRPIVIGYLHLVLLCLVTVFLLFSSGILGLIDLSKSKTPIYLFISFVTGNEILLVLQAMLHLGWAYVPYSNELLFGMAMGIFISLLLLFNRVMRNQFPDLNIR